MAMTKAWFDGSFSGAAVPERLRDLTEKVCRYYWLNDSAVPPVVASMAAVEFSCGDGEGNFSGPLQADDDSCRRLAERVLSQFGDRMPKLPEPQQWLAELLSRITQGQESLLDRFRFSRAEQPELTWDDREVFFSGNSVIDVITAEGRGQFSRQSIAELVERYPDGQILTLAVAADLAERAHIDGTVRVISREAFDEAMGWVPPEDLVIRANNVTFKSSEHFSGRVTSVYAKVGEDFYSFLDLCTLQHDEILEKIDAARRADLTVPGEPKAQDASSTALSM